MEENGILDRELGSTGKSADTYPTTERPWFLDAMSGNEGWSEPYKFYGDEYMGQTYTKVADPERNGVAAVDSEIVCEGDVYVEFKGFGVCTPDTPCHDGQGDCHTDDDCASGLECWHRSNGETRDGYDFCCTGLTASANVDTLDICAVPESRSDTNIFSVLFDESLGRQGFNILVLVLVCVCPMCIVWRFWKRMSQQIEMIQQQTQMHRNDVARPSGKHSALI